MNARLRFWHLASLTLVAVVLSFVLLAQYDAALGHPRLFGWEVSFVAPSLIWLLLFVTGLIRFRAQGLWLLLVAPVAAWPLLSPCSFVPCDAVPSFIPYGTPSP